MNDTSLATIDALENALLTATDRIRPDLLLLGGGVDSALLAAMWKHHGHTFRAITVGRAESLTCTPAHEFLPYTCNSDLEWSSKVATALDLDWTPVALDKREAMRFLDTLVVQHQSFDLGQLNNIALIAALDRAAAWDDRTTFASGDDGDGLFGGYLNAAMHTDWGTWVAERIPHIDPPVRGIGKAMNWQPLFPYLEPEVLAVAKTLTSADIRQSVAVGEQSLPPSFMDQFDLEAFGASERVWGKVILRKVAERYLPYELAWRPKTDLQFGSGMCALEHPLGTLLNAGHHMRIQQTGMMFYNEAHRGLYSRFLSLGGVIPPVKDGEYACPNCGGGLPIGKRHCHTCGHWQGTT